MNISVNNMKLEVKAKLKDMENIIKTIAPFWYEKLIHQVKNLKIYNKVDEFEVLKK